MDNNVLEKFMIEFLIPKVGRKPFLNLKDVRNRKKVAGAITESFSELNIELPDKELDELLNNMIHFQNLEVLKNKPSLEEIEKAKEESKEEESEEETEDDEETPEAELNENKELEEDTDGSK